MKAKEGSIHDILNANKQFIVPVYQRTYNWEREQCERLWEDIVKLQKTNREGHFIGSIVNVIEDASALGVQKFFVIDGQQRLTTLTILLISLRDYCEKQGQSTAITESFLKNTTPRDEDKYKLILTYNDKVILTKLIEKRSFANTEKSRILDAYHFFTRKIEESILTPDEIAQAVAKLQIVNITIDRHSDNPQLIFESLNSTGVDLSQSDLVRNYILMGLDVQNQNNLYQNIWIDIEKLFDYSQQSWLMDTFLRDYLTAKTTRIPKIDHVYEEFKKYHQALTVESNIILSKDILEYARFYTNMFFARSGDTELDEHFKDIRLLKMDVAYPFLMIVYKDFVDQVITRDDFIEVLRMAESYVFRRAICAIPTNSLNKTFATFKNKIVKEDYLNSIKAYFVKIDSYKEFPNDTKFYNSFVSRDIYNMRIRNYILNKLERYDNKEKVDLEAFTIEHVLPENKNLRNGWKEALGENWKEIQAKYLHTIGNLTYTAYNSEMSDRPFSGMEGKLNIKGGFKDSGLRLNRYIREQDVWNQTKIEERANILFEYAKKIWAYPQVDPLMIEKFFPEQEEKIIQYSLNDYLDRFSDNTLMLYENLDKKILNLGSSVYREYKKLYIAYKVDTNFVDIIPLKSKLILSINIPYDILQDPKRLCRDVRGIGRWGNGAAELNISEISQIDDAMDIVSQAFSYQMDN